MQAVLKKGQRVRSERPSDYFLLRGALKCADCGKLLQASRSRGKTGRRYSYYHCRCGLRLPLKRVEDAWAEHLNEIMEHCEKTLPLFTDVVIDVWRQVQTESIVEGEKAAKKLEVIERRQEKLLDLYLAENINAIVYKRKSTDLSASAGVLKTQIHDSALEECDAAAVMGIAKKALSDLGGYYERAAAKDRKRFMQGVFGGPFTIDSNCKLSSSENGGLVNCLSSHCLPLGVPKGKTRNPISQFIENVTLIADLIAA